MISLAGPELALTEGHIYRFRGKEVPGVTTVLREEGLIDDRFFSEEARHRGTIVHRLAELDCEGDLYESDIPDEFRGYLAAVRRFKAETGWVTERLEGKPLAEIRMFSPVDGVAGTADEIGRLRGQMHLTLLDWKSGAPAPATGLQLAGYQHLLYAATAKLVSARIAVEVRADGDYRIHTYKDPTDRDTFFAALRVRNWRLENLPGFAEARKKENAA